MFSEAGKSFKKIFEERITSPLYGSFILSWAIWNWKIIYLTVFVSQEYIKPLTKIDYIIIHYINWCNLIWYPFISAIVLIGLIPLLANQAYRVNLYYEKQRRNWKEKFDAGRRLSIEQSAQLRSEMFEMNYNHLKQIDAKESENKISRQQVELLLAEKTKLQEQLNTFNEENNLF